MLKLLKEIELENAVESIEFKGQKVWPYLRIYVASKLIHDADSKQIDSSVLKSFFSSFFYGFFNLFKSYKYFYFSSSEQRRKTGEIYTDKSIDSIASILKDGLLFEYPAPKHLKKSQVPTKNIVSKFVLYFLVLVYSKIFSRKFEIENEELIECILKKYNISIDYKEIILRHWAQYKVMLFLLKIYKPKAAFFVCYYTNMGYIKALKEKNIKVIEIQHGLINNSHDAYVVFKDIDNTFYPDYLLTFGKKEQEIFTESNYFIREDKTIPLGHFYLDFLANNYKADIKLKSISQKYKKVVAITSQNHYIEKKLIDFIKKSAKLDSSILYIFIPRTQGKKDVEHEFPENVKIIDWLNCYEIIAQADFHSTVFSSCAIEAPSIGVQNIMINLDNLAATFYDKILTNEEISQFVNTPEEYVESILTFVKLDKKEIINSNQEIITPDYLKNLKDKLNIILS